MSRRIFISYNYADKALVHQIKDFFQPEGGLCQGKAISIIPPVGQLSTEEIDRLVLETIRSCDIVLFVIGDNSHNRPWVDREVELAQSLARPRGAVQLPGTNGGLPKGLEKEGLKPLRWDHAELCAALNNFL
ncbi:MAG: toll/interleukin-1 receptor domain-containing protein [Longimicrobiaceae bacterium]